jgi:hypothetical protein
MTIPGGIYSISGSAFRAPNLELISFCPSSTSFRADGGLVRDISGRELIRYFGRLPDCPIARSVEVTCESCFSDCGWLLSITFECDSRLSRIERDGFSRSGLRSIHLPASVEVICESCFDDCESLVSITIDPRSKLEESVFSEEFR